MKNGLQGQLIRSDECDFKKDFRNRTSNERRKLKNKREKELIVNKKKEPEEKMNSIAFGRQNDLR